MQVLIGVPYDHKCDVYSFGICLWEIYCCSIPYNGKFLLLTQVHVNTRYIFNFYVIFFIANVKIISITDIFFEILESKARNTKQMSKCCGQHNEAMLACRPKREARDEGGDAHVRSH